jgi:hypothetical protein
MTNLLFRLAHHLRHVAQNMSQYLGGLNHLADQEGRTAAVGATEAQWDKALAGHSSEERATAKVYTLEP